MHSYNKATQFLRNTRSTRFAPKGGGLNQSARHGGFRDVLVEHFAHLRRRTLRNERDKVIIKIGSAD
jgi:hypothetical protein